MSHPSPPKATAAKASNVFNKTNTATFGSDFGTGTSNISNGVINTTSSLSPDLQQARTTAGQGLNSNLGYLAQSPDQVFGNMAAGSNPYYNQLQMQTQRANDQNVSNARLQAGQLGGANSTALGSTLGRLYADNGLQQSTNASNAFTLGQNAATGNVGTFQNSLTGLANLAYPLASSANSNLMADLASRNQTSQFNAGNQQQVNLANQQAALQQQQQQNSLTGNLVNAGLTGVGMIAAPFTGGASLALPALGNSIMGATGYSSSSQLPGASSLGSYLSSNPSVMGIY